MAQKPFSPPTRTATPHPTLHYNFHLIDPAGLSPADTPPHAVAAAAIGHSLAQYQAAAILKVIAAQRLRIWTSRQSRHRLHGMTPPCPSLCDSTALRAGIALEGNKH